MSMIIGATPVHRNSEEIQAEIGATFRRLSRPALEWLNARQERGHAAVSEVLRVWLHIDGLETERQGLVVEVHRLRDQLAGTQTAIGDLKKDAKARNEDEWDFGKRLSALLKQADTLESGATHATEALAVVERTIEEQRSALGPKGG